MNFRALKYLSVLTVPIIVLIGLTFRGWWTFFPLFYAYAFIPFLEIVIPNSEENLSKAEEEIAKEDPIYDWMLYSIVPAQVFVMCYFIYSLTDPSLTGFETVGRIASYGISCGVMAINVGHELGHRKSWAEKFMSKTLLTTTLYTHFIIEHNYGHHKNVSTDDDPASAKKGEWLYPFMIKSVVGSYKSAWKIETKRLKRANLPFFSVYNEMIRFTLLIVGMLLAIFSIVGAKITLFYIIGASLGFLFLETINYIEHYGLRRKKKAGKKFYEKVQPHHSWNSNHPVGRILLFELTRHSDHHANASRKYQVLRHFDEAPQMPYGYPGMMLLAYFPPLYFKVIHPVIERYKETNPDVLA